MAKHLKYYAIVAIATVAVLGAAFATSSDNSLQLQTTIPEAKAQGHVDAMTEITVQIETNLFGGTVSPEVQRENLHQAEHLVFGKPVILDTNGVTDSIIISDNYDAMVDQIKAAVLACSSGACIDDSVAAQAKELGDRITYWQEIKANLEMQTNDPVCDVNNPVTCQQLWLGDEPQTVGPGISVGIDKIWDGFYREVRSPYFPISPYATSFGPNENIIAVGPMANGECSTVVKEIQGIKAIQRPVKIPIWQEPWTDRAQIIGFQTVWVVDFVPAEFVKSLNYCNMGGQIVFDYTIDVIIERELTHFWKFLPAGWH